jgi:Skp family chaperone for outer membrane proteins
VKYLVTFFISLLILLLVTVYPEHLQSEDKQLIKIGVVDIMRVMKESQKGKEARQYYEGLVPLRSKDELAKTEQNLLMELTKDIEKIIVEYSKKEGFTLIIDGLEGGVYYAAKIHDITDKIIELYNEKVKGQKQQGNQ